MREHPAKIFRVRDLRALMSLLVLVAALLFGGLAWFVLTLFVPADSHPVASALVALAATATGAAIGVVAVGWIMRARCPGVVEGGAPPARLKPEPGDQENLLGNIIDSMEGGLMTISSAGTITSFNPVAQKTLGYGAREVVGRHFGAAFANVPENYALRDMITSALTAHQTFSSVEVSAAASDGNTVDLGVTISPLRAEAGRHRGIVLTFKNLAELNRLREQVQRTDQLASLGRLSAGMAHEIRNPLGSLHGLVELIQEDFAEDDPRRQYTSTILRTVGQLNTLVESLLEFSQPPVTHMEPLDVRELAREGVQLCVFEQQSRGVTLQEDYGQEPLIVLADHETFIRAVINIVRNAFQATPEGGAVTVSVRRQPPQQDDEPDQAVIAVSNTGSYVSPGNRSKLFTPFFTTKSDGTGLGLPIANRTVTAHGGQIEVESAPDSGTTFNLMLPAQPAEVHVAMQENVRNALYE